MKKTENILHIKNLFNKSLKIYQENWFNFLLIGLIMSFVNVIQFFGGISVLISLIASMYIGIGFIRYMLALISGKTAKVKDIFYGVDSIEHFIFVVLVGFISGFIIFFGYLLFIIPGIIIGIGLMFAKYIMVENNGGKVEVLDAIKKSWNITKGHRWKLFCISIVIGLFNLLGFFAFIIGLIITIPVSSLVMTFAYKELDLFNSNKKEEKE